MRAYLDLLNDVIQNGTDRDDRTGTGVRSVFGRQIRFNLADGFPLVTTKKVRFESVVAELLWFISGSTNVRDLQAQGVHIWDPWAAPNGDLGPVYGAQWRNFGGVDQMRGLVEQLRADPYSRRHVVSAWNVPDLPEPGIAPPLNPSQGRMAIAPCHCLFQFYVSDGKLSCQLYQRSADAFIGVPYNIASYALLTHMLAQQCDLEAGEFVHTFGDLHIYRDHLLDNAIVPEQLRREPRPLPTLQLHKAGNLFSYRPQHIQLVGYDPHPFIPAHVSV